MDFLRGLIPCGLVAGALLIFAPHDARTDQVVVPSNDGSPKTVSLETGSASVRQVQFREDRRGFGRRHFAPPIRVLSATYGGNCGAEAGNVTGDLASVCDGRPICAYTIDIRRLGDPSPGCPKNYSAQWQCGDDPARDHVLVKPEAGYGKRIVLRCPVR